MVGNHQYQENFGHQRAKIGPMLAQMESVLKTHLISLYAKVEEKCLITLADNGRKPPIFCKKKKIKIFGHQRAKNGPMLAKIESALETHLISMHTKFEEKCFITFAENGRKPRLYFLATRGPISAQTESILKTHPISVLTKFEEKRLISFADNGREPRV